MKLIIVESPAKCHTISRYVGEGYEVVASLGHIRDLATSGKGGLGVDVEHDFKPTYVINKEKRKTVEELKMAAKKADEVILATDPDREGEAIAWHLAMVLGLDIKKTKRLIFHEITRVSIEEAMKNPVTIDMSIVASQETRRILDRIIGFKLSALLNKKINSRSAGRVQSVTLKMICDHEKEIKKFIPEEYWTVSVKTKIDNKEDILNALQYKNKKIELHNQEDAEKIYNLIGDEIKVTKVEKTKRVRESKEPFITSTMQQEAFNRFKYKTSKTQRIAQKLYEGINIGSETVGLITYMRADSSRLSPTFISRAKAFILEKYGEKYIGKAKGGKKGQDAHEAIRPTSNHRTPESIRQYLTNEQFNIYKMIYERTLASLMSARIDEVTSVTLTSNDVSFKIEGEVPIFDGYSILLKDNENKRVLPKIEVDDVFEVLSKNKEQHFTTPPARYSEAKVVKLMEESGIGRPSTYTSTIDTLTKRKYVESKGGILTPTEQGMLTSHILEKYFPDLVNVEYTANMESELDNVQEGVETQKTMISDFYFPFIKLIDEAYVVIYPEPQKETGENCPKCGAPLVIKTGKNGQFIGCSSFPKCKYVKKEEKKPLVYTGENCPQCGKPLVERTHRGKTFIACSNFPQCHYSRNIMNKEDKKEEVIEGRVCPECGGQLIKKKGRKGEFIACTNFPKCRHTEPIKKEKKTS